MINIAASLEETLRTTSAQAVTNGVLYLLLLVFIVAVIANVSGRWQRFEHYAPNLMTTLGILGTFVGIVIGLLDFKVGSNAEIQASIGPLLEGLKTAFVTSLAGMFAAIVFKTLETFGVLRRETQEETVEHVGPEEIHAELRQQREAVERLTQSIAGDEDATLISQVRLLRSDQRDDMKEQRALLEKQVEHLDFLVMSSKTQISKFDDFSEALWKKLNEFAEMMSRSATEQVISALKEVISDFNRNLTEQFGENFKELNAAVGKLVEWQENYRGQLEEMGKQYAQGVQAISSTEASVTKISEESQKIPLTMGELKTVLETTQHQLAELERHLEAFKDMRDRAVEAVPEIKKQMDAMAEDVAAASKDAGEQVKLASQALNTAITDGAKEFENSVNRTNQGLSTASDQLVSNSERIQNQLDATFKDVNERAREMIDTLAKSNNDLEVNIQGAQDQVTKSIESMQGRLEGSLEQVFREQTDSMNKTFGALDEEISKTVGRTGEAVNKQLEAMDESMQQELVRVITALGENLAAITTRFTEDYSVLTSQMKRVVDQAGKFDRGSRQ